jgi:alcohol dehydrogenase class IV
MWKGLGVAHALAIPLDVFDLHHGTLVGMLLPEAVRFARPVSAAKLALLDQVLGGQTEECLTHLNHTLGLPSKLSAMGVPADALKAVAQAASQSVFNKSAPRPATGAEYEAMLDRVF